MNLTPITYFEILFAVMLAQVISEYILGKLLSKLEPEFIEKMNYIEIELDRLETEISKMENDYEDKH